jgi:hypothetical protein
MRNVSKRDETTKDWQPTIRLNKVQPGKIHHRADHVNSVYEERDQRQRESIREVAVTRAIFRRF